MPRYICRQRIERQSYVRKKPSAACEFLSNDDSAKPLNALRLTVVDRATLDVILGHESELFSWPGKHEFDTDNPANLLGGGFAGNGDFASFVQGVFSIHAATFSYLGPCERPSCVRYGFDVPQSASRYQLKIGRDTVIVGYHGSFDVDTASADLLRMSVIPTKGLQLISGICDLRTRMVYTRHRSSIGEFMIPSSTEREFIANDGSYFKSRVTYEGCHEYGAESVISFGDDAAAPAAAGGPPPVASSQALSGAELELRLRSKIDSETSSAGDDVEAAVTHAVTLPDGGAIPAGTLVRGHLSQMQKLSWPRRAVNITIRFDTIVLNGRAVPAEFMSLGPSDERGRGVFHFPNLKVVLDHNFLSRWRIR